MCQNNNQIKENKKSLLPATKCLQKYLHTEWWLISNIRILRKFTKHQKYVYILSVWYYYIVVVVDVPQYNERIPKTLISILDDKQPEPIQQILKRENVL